MKVSKADYIIGDRIHGRYEITNFLGEGGIAQVYQCVDLSTHETVAVKVFQPLPTTPDLVRQGTEREAHTMASVRHPNVVSVLNIGHTQKGFFIVMELVKGLNLAELMKERALTQTEFLPIARQTLEGLGAVHRNGFLHLDIKPANIMLAEERPGFTRVKLVDFGLAQLNGTESLQSPDGEILGSIFYISPERLTGEKPLFYSDFYSLGHTFYHLLAGHPAFHYCNAETVADAHLHHDAPDLSTLRPDIDPELCQIIHWMIHREIENRPTSTLEILSSLNKVLLRSASADAAIALPAPPPALPVTKKWTNLLFGWLQRT